MALFQPTNIIPSSFTVGVVDADKDIAQVSWQVNGNSPMTAFEIDFYRNTTDSPVIANTAKTLVITSSLDDGFYGTNRFGQPQMYTFTAKSQTLTPQTWSQYRKVFKNGEEYKFKITQYWQDGGEEKSIGQIEGNVFKTRSTPQVSIYFSNSTYKSQTAISSGAAIYGSSIGYFKGVYKQAEGDAVKSVRWQIATASQNNGQWGVNEILSDTGDVNTAILNFEFNGFFDNQDYAVRCTVESEEGQQAEIVGSENDGWLFFSVAFPQQKEYEGEFTLQCIQQEKAAHLQWTGFTGVETTTIGGYTLSGDYGGCVTLLRYTELSSSITWKPDTPFAPAWTFAMRLLLPSGSSSQSVSWSQYYQNTFYSDSTYRSVTTQTVPPVSLAQNSVQISDNRRSVTITLQRLASSATNTTRINFVESPRTPLRQIASIRLTTGDTITITCDLDANSAHWFINIASSEIDAKIDCTDIKSTNVVLAITPSKVIIYDNGAPFASQSIVYTQQTIENVQIMSGYYSHVLEAARFNSVAVYQGDVSEETLNALYSQPYFKPSWEDENYQLYLAANFDGNLGGGRISKIRIYRQEIGKGTLEPIFYLTKGNITQLKDYGIVSRKSYTYYLYEYDNDDAYSMGTQCTVPDTDTAATISTCFNCYSLLVCDYDSENDAYHVRKQYLFALNLSEGSVGNNNSPTLNANFTAYPTRMPSTQNYASGTLQGLIGVIYTVPALVEQIGGFKHTAKPSTLDYFDSVDLEKELYDLSVSPYQLFLRDMKGHLRMVATNGAITMTQDLKKWQLSTSISLPWVEIGDASDVTIIQTPDDYGWNNDEQVLDVRLDVDPTTGILTATYPKPYNGTKFYLTGADKEILGAETPLGVTPAQFALSAAAKEPDDGTLTATAKVNTEEGD